MAAAAEEETFKAPAMPPSVRPAAAPKPPDSEKLQEDAVVEDVESSGREGTKEGRMDAEKEDSEETGDEVAKKETTKVKTAEDMVILPPGIPYSVPEWSGRCPSNTFSLEVLKSGSIIDNIDLSTRPLHILGRLPSCHLTMEHPSLSRFHAVLQFNAHPELMKRPAGWYLFDLDSTHGTWVNKVKVRPMEFHRVRVGHVLKFGGSTRLYVIQGPPDDREEEAALSYSELKAQRDKMRAESEALRASQRAAAEQRRLEAENRKLVQNTCSWGFNEDAVEEDEGMDVGSEEVMDLSAEAKHEEQFKKDPKKVLRGYFEREGYDVPEFEFLDAGFNKHHCRVELTPLQVTSGRPTYAEAIISGGKKKEAVLACALEACRLLDRMGELYKAATSRAVRRQRDWEANEFYDSDEDTFLDRTGDIERKRAKRMAMAGKAADGVEESAKEEQKRPDTFESLNAQWAKLMSDLQGVEAKLNNAKKELAGGEQPAESELDALDAYMAAIKAGALDRRARMALRMQLTQMRAQKEILRRRLQASAPSLSQLALRQTPKSIVTSTATEDDASVKKDEDADHDKGVGTSKSAPTGRMRFSLRAPTAVRKPCPVPVHLESMEPDTTQPEEDEEEDEKDVENEGNEGKIEVEGVEEKSSSAVDVKSSIDASQGPESPPMEVRLDAASTEKLPSKIGPVQPDRLPTPPPPPPESSSPPDEASKKRKRRRHRKAENPSSIYNFGDEEEGDVAGMVSLDKDYVSWVPPQNQTGDGRTRLNEKFGY